MKIPIKDIEFVRPGEMTPEDKERFDELTNSIKLNGLMHGIIVRPTNNTPPFKLVTGLWRILAMETLGGTEIEAETRELTDEEAQELSIEENLRRRNLSWYDESVLVHKLHTMKQEKLGAAKAGRPKAGVTEKQGWSVRDTAALLKKAVGPTVESLNLYVAVQNNPSLRNVKDKRTAVRLARVESMRMETEASAGLPTSIEVNQAYLGDSAEILKNIPTCTFDACITDPPWLSFFDPKLVRDERTLPVFKEVYRVLKPDAFLYLICGLDDYVYYAGYDYPDDKGEVQHSPGALEKIGFSVSKTPVIWRKMNALSRRGVRPWEYDRDFEFILVAVKGAPVLTSQTKMSSFKDYAVVPPPKMIHANEKPLGLMENLIDDCTFQGALVLEPFGGSGVTAEACIRKKRRYVIIERDPESYKKIQRRTGVIV